MGFRKCDNVNIGAVESGGIRTTWSLGTKFAKFPLWKFCNMQYAYWICVSSPQGYYRRASANMAMGRFKAALKDYEAVSEAT